MYTKNLSTSRERDRRTAEEVARREEVEQRKAERREIHRERERERE